MKVNQELMVARARELTRDAKLLTELAEQALEETVIATARASLAWGHVRRMRSRS